MRAMKVTTLQRIALASARNPWTTIGAWVAETDPEATVAPICVTGFTDIVDQRKAAPAQRLQVHRFAGPQLRDQCIDVGIRP